MTKPSGVKTHFTQVSNDPHAKLTIIKMVSALESTTENIFFRLWPNSSLLLPKTSFLILEFRHSFTQKYQKRTHVVIPNIFSKKYEFTRYFQNFDQI